MSKIPEDEEAEWGRCSPLEWGAIEGDDGRAYVELGQLLVDGK